MQLSSFPPPPGGAPRTASTLGHWAFLTRRALDAGRAGRLEIALAGHVQALWLAEALVGSAAGLAREPDDRLAALVVSHHNLADLYRLRGPASQALLHLCEPQRLLLALAGRDDQPPAVRVAARRHLRETHSALLQWQRRHGAEATVEALLRAPAPLHGPQAAHDLH